MSSFKVLLGIAVPLVGLLSLGCSEGGAEADPEEGVGLVDGRELASEVGDTIEELYEKAKETGRPVAEDAIEWTKEDVERIGDWQYRILLLPETADAELESQLNELGTERWEVFWVERRQEGLRLFLKRPARSYLKAVTEAEPWRLVPSDSGGE